MLAHGLHEFPGPFRQGDGFPDLFENRSGLSGQKGHAMFECGFEIQLAVHRSARDGCDVFPAAQKVRQFVQGFASDDGAVHVRDEDGPAATACFEKQRIDTIGREGCADRGDVGRTGARRRAGNVDRFARRQDDRRVTLDERAGHVDGLGFEGTGFPVCDEGQDGRKGHEIS